MMRPRSIRVAATTVIVTIATSISFARAGDLMPPVGPVMSTMKTLTEVEPRIAINATNTPGDADSEFKITQGGGYYLTGNLSGVAGKMGIEVSTADPVTIDLKGYALLGVAGSLDGIGGFANAIIRNGAATGWGQNGINVSRGIIDRIHVGFNGQNGIRGSWGNVITNCTAEGNMLAGISVGDVSRIHGCMCKGNNGWGIKLDGVVLVTECVLYNNTPGGVMGGLATIKDCEFFTNQGPAIHVVGSSKVLGNHVVAGGGILVTGTRSHIEGNTVIGTGTGFDVDGTDNLIIRNTARGNTTDYDIGADNAFGPIVNVNRVGDISATPGADHPSANLRY